MRAFEAAASHELERNDENDRCWTPHIGLAHWRWVFRLHVAVQSRIKKADVRSVVRNRRPDNVTVVEKQKLS